MAPEPPDRETVNSIFGTELPQVSAAERGADAQSEDAERERWLRENVPPHYI